MRSVREECLNRLLIRNQAHLWQVLSAYMNHYNTQHSHWGLAQQTPIPHESACPMASLSDVTSWTEFSTNIIGLPDKPVLVPPQT